MRPLAHYCLRNAVRLPELIECAKTAFLEAAQSDLQKRQARVTTSRLSVMTGVHRKDIIRLGTQRPEERSPADIITKVLGQWQTAPQYTTKDGTPRVLAESEGKGEFSRLVRSVSLDVNPATILFELERVGAVMRSKNGIKLQWQSYVPKGDVDAGFEILSKDIDDLTRAVESNTIFPEGLPHFHARTEFDKVRADALTHLKQWCLKQGHEFHAAARQEFSRYDQDINPDLAYKGNYLRVRMTGFSLITEDNDHEKKN